jgi:hypothetical protein
MADIPCARRRALLMLGVAGALVSTGTPAAEQRPGSMKKYTKERVGYRDEPYQGRTCAKCVLYNGHGECAIVEGEVSVNGWCIQWTPATMGQAGPRIA